MKVFDAISRLSINIVTKLSEKKGPLTDSWTDYMSWLTFANAGMLSRGNAFCFDYAIQHLPSTSPIVEIGSFCGLSTNLITYYKEKYNIKNSLITCDKWVFEGAELGGMLGDSKMITHEEYKAFVKETFIRNTKMFSRFDLPYTIEEYSDDFFCSWSANEVRRDVFGRECQLGGPISFCYIDGNHTYNFAKRDFINVDRYLEKNGFIMFDDSSLAYGPEVYNVVQEALDSGCYEIVSKNPNYLLLKK